MSFNFSFLTNSGDRAKALTAAQSPPESVMAFVSAAVDAIGVLPDGWLIQVTASGHLDLPAGASAVAHAADTSSVPPAPSTVAAATAGEPAQSAPPPTTPPPAPSAMPMAMSQGCTISVVPLQIME